MPREIGMTFGDPSMKQRDLKQRPDKGLRRGSPKRNHKIPLEQEETKETKIEEKKPTIRIRNFHGYEPGAIAFIA